MPAASAKGFSSIFVGSGLAKFQASGQKQNEKDKKNKADATATQKRSAHVKASSAEEKQEKKDENPKAHPEASFLPWR
jgi:hypothetical protein